MREVETNLRNADGMQSNPHRDVHMIFTEAREATQRAEDARITTLRKQAEESARNETAAKEQAQANAAQANANAEQSKMEAVNAQARADAAAADKARADAQRARAETDAANARAQAAEAQRNAQHSQQDAAAVREKLRQHSKRRYCRPARSALRSDRSTWAMCFLTPPSSR